MENESKLAIAINKSGNKEISVNENISDDLCSLDKDVSQVFIGPAIDESTYIAFDNSVSNKDSNKINTENFNNTCNIDTDKQTATTEIIKHKNTSKTSLITALCFGVLGCTSIAYVASDLNNNVLGKTYDSSMYVDNSLFSESYNTSIKSSIINLISNENSGDNLIESNAHIYNSIYNSYTSVKKSNRHYVDNNSLDKIIFSYASKSRGKYSDNNYFKNLRNNDAILQLEKYGLDDGSNVLIVNKTFQKAMIARMTKEPFIYSSDSLESFRRQGRDAKVFANDSMHIIEMKQHLEVLLETDCSTGKTYGHKERTGDSKTPEGIFKIYSVEDSHDWIFDGKLVYGPRFFRIQNSIGLHGNGTDNGGNNDLRNDSRYKNPEPLGIHKNNFGYGLSHGCVRFDNEMIREMYEHKMLKNGMSVIIFEDTELTDVLSKNYR